MQETWKPVVGYEDLYEVSDLGRVRSLDRVIEKQSRWPGVRVTCALQTCVLKATNDTKGYPQVTLSKDGVVAYFRVHQLVLRHFVGEPPEHQEARHMNGVRSDNRLNNLCYGTRKENHADKNRHGTALKGEDLHNAKLTEFGVRVIRRLVGSLTGREIANIFGVGPMTISRVKNSGSWTHV
jgi:hypothetical protein